MAHQAEVPATRPDHPSSIPRTLMMEKENGLPQNCPLASTRAPIPSLYCPTPLQMHTPGTDGIGPGRRGHRGRWEGVMEINRCLQQDSDGGLGD